ncbi:helix-turn-helix domain-containing protein [Herbidospora galbida]|nr:helix-turn-helix domain-containing protein [Herbidospora galbida]
MSIGGTISEAREQRGLSVADLSRRTRIREAIIVAIERDDFSACNGDFYARGHLRALARELGLEGDDLVREYDALTGGPRPGVGAMYPIDKGIKLRERRTPNWTLAMAVALAIVAVFGVGRIMGSAIKAPEKQSVKVNSAPAAVKAAPPAAAPAAPAKATHVTVKITATSEAWIQVRDAKKKRVFMGVIPSGDSRSFRIKDKARLTFGNAGSVQLNVNGRDLGAPGRAGETVTRTYGVDVPVPR